MHKVGLGSLMSLPGPQTCERPVHAGVSVPPRLSRARPVMRFVSPGRAGATGIRRDGYHPVTPASDHDLDYPFDRSTKEGRYEDS
jgi:hypothetical protein